MDYGEKTLGEVGTSLVTSGAGTAGGFVLGAFVGRQVQNSVFKKPDPATGGFAKMTDAAMAWFGNNLPKGVLWYLAGKTRFATAEPGEALTPGKEVTVDARKALAGSIVFDTLMRLANGGANPATAKLFGWQVLGNGQEAAGATNQADIQRLIQENGDLRSELNKILQQMAIQPHITQPQIAQTPPAIEERERRYGQMYDTTPPEVIERERRFGQMAPQTVAEREKLFGFASGKAEGTKDVAAMFGML